VSPNWKSSYKRYFGKKLESKKQGAVSILHPFKKMGKDTNVLV
jgi:hypothetical protein